MTGMLRAAGWVILATWSLGCEVGGHEGSGVGDAGWRLDRDLVLGSAEAVGPESFGYVAAVHVDERGRIWVSDGPSREIRVFDDRGAFVRAMGGAGEGPGELGAVTGLEPGPDGHVWVADGGNHRWTVFDSAGSLVATHPYAPGMYRFGDRWGSDGLLYTWVMVGGGPAPDFAMVRRRLDAGGVVPVDTLPVPPADPGRMTSVAFERDGRRMTAFVPVPFQPVRHRLLVAGTGWWLSHPGRRYRVARVGPRGDTVVVVERDHVEVPVSDDDIAAALYALAPNASLARDELPEVHPPVKELAVLPDGHLLVRRRAPRGEVWDVFTADGRFVAELDVPGGARFRLMAATDDALYGVLPDDLDVSRVVRLRLRRPE